jgi:demethylspheroidene O-methyltransferase
MAVTQSDRRARTSGAAGRLPKERHDLRDRIMNWRDSLLASPRFQRFAAAFPLTRPVARRQTEKLFDLCAGFVYSQVLAACVQLDLFQMLREQPMTAEAVSTRLDIPVDAIRRLLGAAVSLGLLAERSGGRYGLGMLGAALTGNPGIAAMIAHHSMLYDDLRDPVALLRKDEGGTQLSRYWAYAADRPDRHSITDESVAGYTALMAASQALIAEDILAAHDFRQHVHVLDVGGGDGTFLITAGLQVPHLRLTLFDLPPVAKLAAQHFETAGFGGRAEAVGGNFVADLLPKSADLIVLNRILLDHDDHVVRALLASARKAIAPHGTLLIAEPISGLTGSPQVTDAYFNLYLFAMGRGRSRSFQELRALVQGAGFYRVKAKGTRRPLLTNVVIARPKPDRM